MSDGTPRGSAPQPQDAVPARPDPREGIALGDGADPGRPRGEQPGPDETMLLGVPLPPPDPGYGYPHQPTQIGLPSYLPQQPGPVQGGYGYPQAPAPHPAPAPFPQSPSGPDWQAMADDTERTARRRKRLWTTAIVVIACVLGAGVGLVVVKGTGGTKTPQAHSSSTGSPSPSPSPSPSGPSVSPTVPQQVGAIADHSGQIPLAPGSDALVSKANGSEALALRGNVDSFGEATQPVVDVSKSFTVSAWVYNDKVSGPHTAVSQGDGTSFSFNLGRADSNGSTSWEFRVQSGGQGADSTTYQVRSAKVGTVNQWVLLTGTYDSTAHTIALYLNGAAAGSKKVPGIWNGPGPLEIGRARHHSLWDGFWTGNIGHIQVWNRALTAAEAAGIKSGAPDLGSKPVDSWLVG